MTVARDSSYLPDPSEFDLAADQAASRRSASVMSAHTAEQIISMERVGERERSGYRGTPLTRCLPLFRARDQYAVLLPSASRPLAPSTRTP